RGTASRTYELAGPTVYTLRELVGFVQRLIGRRPLVVPVPFAVAEGSGAVVRAPAEPAAHHEPSRPSQGGQRGERACRVSGSSASSRKPSRKSCRFMSAGCGPAAGLRGRTQRSIRKITPN